MLFNSFSFIFFYFPIVVIGFYLIRSRTHEGAIALLAGASIYFFCQWNLHYLWLLLLSIIMNFTFGCAITAFLKISRKRALLLLRLSLAFNILILGYYKYTGFFLETMHQAFGTQWSLGQIILPLGISFFTFTQIAFLVDSYQGKVKEYSFLNYLLFVTYFPHLIAGPILHHAQMMPQFQRKDTYSINWENNSKGLMMFIIGLAKKTLVADYFSTIAKPIFESASLGNTPLLVESWMGVFAYTLQLYFDFSGYCDMAIGISLFFNIRLPFNFNSPYKSLNIIDFWRRWHITLSTFLRDYLYIPLGGNRHGYAKRYINILVTMLIGGLWHGAGWTFVVWGGLHGIYLLINHAFRDLCNSWTNHSPYVVADRLPARLILPVRLIERTLSSGMTFLAVSTAWVFFRSNDLPAAFHVLAGMIGKNCLSWHHHAHLEIYWPIYIGLLAVWFLPNSQEWIGLEMSPQVQTTSKDTITSFLFKWNPNHWWNWAMPGIIFAICILVLTNGKPSEFLYFQF
jgi:alginate O-acetyltransferase complex protein AlgI